LASSLAAFFSSEGGNALLQSTTGSDDNIIAGHGIEVTWWHS
jgi:hypothetical protein